MNKHYRFILIILHAYWLWGCSPVKSTVSNQYKLEAFSNKQLSPHFSRQSILIAQPEAVSGYQTEQMLYMDKAYEVSSFANNAWIAPPADMLFPLLLQSVQRSGYFYAVASSANADQTDYKLDTQLLTFQQNFLTKPSQLRFTGKIVLTHVADTRIVASRIIELQIPCPADTPYGGVLAANKASLQFTQEVSSFLIQHVRKDQA